MKPPPFSLTRRHARAAEPPASQKPLSLDEDASDAPLPGSEELQTALDDDEGGADPIDPDTGVPYDDSDAGEAGLPAGRRGSAPDI